MSHIAAKEKDYVDDLQMKGTRNDFTQGKLRCPACGSILDPRNPSVNDLGELGLLTLTCQANSATEPESGCDATIKITFPLV